MRASLAASCEFVPRPMEFLLMAATILAASCPGAVYGDHEGTTSKIEDIFKGRCEYFRQFRLPESSTLRNLDCGTVWNAFTAAFKNKNECDVESQDYATFLDMTEMQIPEDKVTEAMVLLLIKHMLT